MGEYRRATKGAVKRRKFIQRFDLFLADGRIAQPMRTQFGKEVYRSKKVPHCVRLSTDPVAFIDLLKRTTQLVFGADRPGLEVKVGQMASGNDVLLDNLQCLVEGLDLRLPRGALNIKQLKLRSQSSRAYHLYAASIIDEDQ